MSMPHICTVSHKTSQTYLPFKEDTKNPLHKFCRCMRNSMMVWKNHPYFAYYCRSTTAYYEERRRHANSRYFYIIHPISQMCFYLEMILMVAYPLAFVSFPLTVSFYNIKNVFAENRFIFEEILRYIFIAEILIRCFVGRKEQVRKEVSLNHPRIIRKYVFSTAFIGDVCGALPVSPLPGYIQDPYILHGIAALRLFKFLRLRSFIHYFHKFLTILGLNVYSGVSNFFILTSFFFHWCTCIYHGIPRLRGSLLTGDIRPIMMEYQVPNNTLAYYIETSFRSMGMLLSAKRDIRVFTGVEQKITCVVYGIFGKIFMMALGVVFINQILRNDELETKYRQVLAQLNEFMTHRKLPTATRQRLLTFYEYKFQGKFVKETKIQNILSDRLKKEINFHNSNKLVKQVEMFEDIPTKILAEVLSNLRVEVFLPNDRIIRAGAVAECMYFISNGTVSVTTASGREVCHLQDGGYFGEAALVLNHKKSISNVTALEICETYRLDSKTFRKCFKDHPQLLAKLKAEATKREEQTIKLEEEFQEKLFLKTYMGDKRRETFDSDDLTAGKQFGSPTVI